MLLSIIIPAYNCADTLETAVSSAVLFKDAEIIIVDDGSTGNTPEIIKMLTEKYPSVNSVKQKNAGPASARNTGIDIAKGEYVMFIDSDDTFADNAYPVISANLDADILIFGFKQCFFGRAEDKIYSLSSPFTVDEYYSNNLLNQVWNKAYKREFLNKNSIRFKDYRYGEDRIFNAEALNCNPNVKAIPDVLYNYNIDKSVSLISGYIPEKFDACKIISFYFSTLCENKATADFMFLKNVLSCMTVLFADNCKLTSKEKKEEIKRIITDADVKNALCEKQSGKANEIIRRIIISGNVTANYWFSFAVAFCQKHFLPLFLKFRK
ncbi:MAG: glycosyltransferase [Clostridia bacterium]|nr:glycosyltransferase [Clostridia bacterium]